MKITSTILIIIALSTTLLLAQSSDSAKTGSDKPSKKKMPMPEALPQHELPGDSQQTGEADSLGQKLEGFVDVNGDGIDDRLEQARQKRGKHKGPRDRFIDADGDGICDGNESALGLRKLYRKRKGHPGK